MARRSKPEATEVAAFLAAVPSELRGVVASLRRLIRRCAPAAAEAVRFHALCYSRPFEPFGSIGGNICMIEAGGARGSARGTVKLSFIHGASLPDPHAILQGTAKAKRFILIRSSADVRRADVGDLIRAAACARV